MIDNEKPVKAKQVAGILGVSQRTVIRWIAKKGLPAYKPGRCYIFYVSEINEWLERKRT